MGMTGSSAARIARAATPTSATDTARLDADCLNDVSKRANCLAPSFGYTSARINASASKPHSTQSIYPPTMRCELELRERENACHDSLIAGTQLLAFLNCA